ncbi:MAG: hypothetical protein ALECFALPRED_005981 [Alectoria fallacina]|uniref:Major facilitator superfamily (MFS) profile domain-containing protein n=1 Tax=Alectoria fallacina TaxID=1903189 RepID=A0A8H3EN62_9LECA|nr:MAG: hypothetical protein ALECFALPRED_005981 [Alectoria fallacina]
MALTEHDNAEEPPSETSPLLGNGNGKATPDDAANPDRETDGAGDNRDENHVPLAEEAGTGKILLVMSSIWLGTFLAALDSTIIATLSAPISDSFNSLSLLSWLASAYFIANAALQPLSGRLTDILSRRTGLIFSNVFFAAGNLICGLATSEWVMIFGRVIAGMGGGGLNAISTFVGSDLVPLRRRGVWQGFGNICFGVGSALGGVFGGWINDTWGWRKAFLIQVPFTVVSGFIVFFTVKIPVKHSSKSAFKRIDFLGAAALITTLVLLLVGLNSGGNVVPWNHPLIYTTLPLSFLSLFLFIYIESKHASEPIIPVKLLLNRTVLAACLTNWFLTMCAFSLVFYAPIYFQVQGLSTTQAGARLIPMSIGTGIGSVSTGLIMRWTGKYYILNICILLVFTAAYALMSIITLATPAWQPVLAFFMAGLGYSGMLTITLLALISAVDHKDQAVITSASYAFRSTGSAIGITIASAVFQNILKIRLWAEFGDRKDAAGIIGKLRDSLDVIKTLPVEWRGEVREIYTEALRGVFLTTLGICIIGGLISLAMREHVLHKTLERK